MGIRHVKNHLGNIVAFSEEHTQQVGANPITGISQNPLPLLLDGVKQGSVSSFPLFWHRLEQTKGEQPS